MRATITVYGEQGSGKTRWLEQMKRALLATAPIEAVEVTAIETHREPGTSRHVSEQFDEFTIPAADAEGSVGVAGDRETWSVVPYGIGENAVYCGGKRRGTFVQRSDAELFTQLKSMTSDQWQAVVGVLDRASFRFNGERPLWSGSPIAENCKGGGGEIAEGAGVIPFGVYWSDTGGNFYDALSNRGMGTRFYRQWASRKYDFPQTEFSAHLRMWGRRNEAKLSAAEAPAIHDAWPTPMVTRAQRDELAAKVQALEAKLDAVICHATGDNTTSVALPLNDICVRITKHQNRAFTNGARSALEGALREIADMAGVILPVTLEEATRKPPSNML